MTLEKWCSSKSDDLPPLVDSIITIATITRFNWSWQMFIRHWVFWRAYLGTLSCIQCCSNDSKWTHALLKEREKRPHLEPIDSCNSCSIFKIFKTYSTHSVTWMAFSRYEIIVIESSLFSNKCQMLCWDDQTKQLSMISFFILYNIHTIKTKYLLHEGILQHRLDGKQWYL